MTDYVVEDHELQYHVTTEDHIKNYPEGQYVINDQHIMLVE